MSQAQFPQTPLASIAANETALNTLAAIQTQLSALSASYDAGGKTMQLIERYTVPVGTAVSYDFALVGSQWQKLELRFSYNRANAGQIAKCLVLPDGSSSGCILRGNADGVIVASEARVNLIAAANTDGCDCFWEARFIAGKWAYIVPGGPYYGSFPQVTAYLQVKQGQAAGGNFTAGSVFELYGARA